MKKYILMFLFLYGTNSNSLQLDGEWIVDVDKTATFNSTQINMSDLEYSLLKCSMKNISLYFYQGKGRIAEADHSCTHNGKNSLIKGYAIDYEYNELYDGSKYTVLVTDKNSENEAIEIIHWLDKESFWIDNAAEDSIVRFFYKKINKN